MLIYALRNIKSLRPDGTGKVYVGKTKFDDPQTRWVGHQNEAFTGSTFCIHNAIRKYGKDAFVIEVLEDGITDPNLLCGREVFWIAALNSQDDQYGYNMTSGGDNPPSMTGIPKSEEWKQKAGQRMQGNKLGVGRIYLHSQETKEKLSTLRFSIFSSLSEEAKREQTQAGRTKIDELRGQGLKMGGAPSGEANFMFGKQHTEESRKKISESKIGKPGYTNKGRLGQPHSEESKKLMSQRL